MKYQHLKTFAELLADDNAKLRKELKILKEERKTEKEVHDLSIAISNKEVKELEEKVKTYVNTPPPVAPILPPMTKKQIISFDELEILFDRKTVTTQKIKTIKTVRELTGCGLKEGKEWVEGFLTSFHTPKFKKPVVIEVEDIEKDKTNKKTLGDILSSVFDK